jgi:uncharacterized protein DUF4231
MTTANPAKPVAKKKSRARWRDLFFFRRRPRLRGVTPEWEKPADDDAYQKMIQDEGFVSSRYWDKDDVSKYPIIMRDLKDLEQYLLPTFFQFSRKSTYFQNQFYLFQWVFVWGAFLTTVFGSVSALYSLPPGQDVITQTQHSAQYVQQIFSILTAIVGAVTAFFTALSNRGDPLKRWGKNRRLAEELRMHYFTYLSHIAPYDQADRVQKLRENVINIRVKEQENV